MDPIRITPDLVVRLASAVEGEMSHTRKLNAFAKALGFPSQTALMHALKSSPPPGPSLDEMLEAAHAHHLTLTLTREGLDDEERKVNYPGYERPSLAAWRRKKHKWSRLGFRGLEWPLRGYLEAPADGVSAVLLAEGLRHPFSSGDVPKVLGEEAYGTLLRMSGEAAAGQYPDLNTRLERAALMRRRVKEVWDSLPRSARRQRRVSRAALSAAARAVKPGMRPARRAAAIYKAWGYKGAADMKEAIAFLAKAEERPQVEMGGLAGALLRAAEAALDRFREAARDKSALDHRSQRLIATGGVFAVHLRRSAVDLGRAHPDTVDEFYDKAAKDHGAALRAVISLIRAPWAADLLALFPDLPPHALDEVSVWARNVILIGAENRVMPLDRARFRDMIAARGPVDEDGVWKMDIGEDLGATMIERHFDEKMTLLSIEPDPVVAPVEGGWETRPVSLSTRADAAGPLLAAALDDLRGSTGAGFFIEDEDRVKAALEAALAAVRAESLDPAALRAAVEGLGVLMPSRVGRDEASRGAGANERLWLRGVRARGARRKAFRAAAIIRAGLPSS